jgi:hypothetical protein
MTISRLSLPPTKTKPKPTTTQKIEDTALLRNAEMKKKKSGEPSRLSNADHGKATAEGKKGKERKDACSHVER